MMKKSILYFLMIALIIGIVGCSDDNSTTPEVDYQNLNVPDDFNWTNLEYIKLNISSEDGNMQGKAAVVVRNNDKVLARKFLTDGQLTMNVNSVKGYDNLTVTIPAYDFSQEISTSTKEHNIVIPATKSQRFTYVANNDPYFLEDPSADTSAFVSINGVDPNMVESLMNGSNVHIPTEVPQANTGWHKVKFDDESTGDIRRVTDGLNSHLLMGAGWVVMQTVDVENYDYFNENLEGAITENTASIDQCLFGSYLTNTFIFLDENMNYVNFFPWPPWPYTDTNRFFSDRTENRITNAKYMVMIAQYNGPEGNVRLDNWLITLFDTESTPSDRDGDGVIDSEDLEPGNPNIAGEITAPGGFVMFEDLWPDKGDYDFNDLYIFVTDSSFKVNADNKIVYYDLYFKVMKAGASLHNGLGLRFIDAVTTGATTTYNTIDTGNMLNSVLAYSLPQDWSTGDANGDWSTMTYIDKFSPNTAVLIHDIGDMDLTVGDDISLRINFDPTQEQAENPIPDFFLFRSDSRDLEVHLAGYPPTGYANMDNFNTGNDASLLYPGNWYKTEDNYPWALYFSSDNFIPAVKENIPIFRAYPDFAGWVTSGGELNQDWYLNYDRELTESPWED